MASKNYHHRQQAKLFEERMANVFSGVDNAPSGEQINMTFQKMAGTFTFESIIYQLKKKNLTRLSN